MNRKRAIIALTLLAMATTAFAIGSNSIAQRPAPPERGQAQASSPTGLRPRPDDTNRPPQQPPPSHQPETVPPAMLPADQDVPEHVIYGQIFRHIKELRKTAEEEERQGRDGAHLRTLYQRMAQLSPPQAAALDEIATETNAQLDELTNRAQQIIREIRGQHPEGRLAPGEQPPVPPAELQQLSAQRRELLLQAREQLRTAYGEEEFQRFSQFVQQRVRPGIRRIDNGNRPPQGGPGQ